MGVDLTLLPLIGEDFWAAHTKLDLERRRELWTPISALTSWPVTFIFSSFVAPSPVDDFCYGDLSKDGYGTPLKWTTVAELWKVASHPGVINNWQNKAVWAYLGELPPYWKVVLFWH